MTTSHKTRNVLRSCRVPVWLRERRVTVRRTSETQVKEPELKRKRHWTSKPGPLVVGDQRLKAAKVLRPTHSDREQEVYQVKSTTPVREDTNSQFCPRVEERSHHRNADSKKMYSVVIIFLVASSYTRAQPRGNKEPAVTKSNKLEFTSLPPYRHTKGMSKMKRYDESPHN